MNEQALKIGSVLALIGSVVLMRLLPHPANVTPLIATALVSGAAFSRRPLAFLIPLAALFVSDLALGLHDQMISVYGSIMLITLFGYALSERRTALRVASASVISSVAFFLITNFTVWTNSGMYPRNGAGLLECYTMALPFLRNGVIGDLAYSGVLFGLWALVENRRFVKAA